MRIVLQIIARELLVCVALGIGMAAFAAEDLAGVPEEIFADFMAGEIQDERDLADVVEIQRRWFNRITPPGFSWVQPMFPSVAPFDAENFDEPFLDDLLGEDKNSVAIYPLSLSLDPKTRETLVYNADGKLIAAISADRIFRDWPEDADPARVVLQLDLLPSEDVEPYLYVEGRLAESVKARSTKPERSEGMVLRSLGAGEFGFAGAYRLTNGQMRLIVTNGTNVAEIYSYTVWHTSTVVVTVWTNEYDEVVTSTNLVWDPVSPPYAGIESEWECQTTNLVLSGGVGTWDDADVSTNARVRFYAAAKRMDSDGDGLTDGMEIFLYRTDPGLPDSDGDGVGDGAEVGQGGDPLDPAEYPVDPDLEAALAGINVAQIGYLSYLCDQTFAYEPSTNYAQRIQTLREALEGLAGSFLDLDVNVDGVLAERTNVVVWTLDTVLSSTGNESGDWLEGLASTSQVEEIAAVLGQLTHLVHEGSTQTGYPHQGVVTQAAPFMVVSPWDLGTGYPEDWPTNQPIKTYLLLDTKIDIPNVGLGTVDDWIELNGTARFPSYGEIYTNHIADISAPIWDPAGTNRLELWDCGDCAGPNDYAYLSPFKVVQVLEAPVLNVEFKESAQNNGFDDTTDPNWLVVPVNNPPNTKTAKAEITPTASASSVTFESADTGKATVSPATASTSPETVTVTGVTKSETTVKAKVGSADCRTLSIAVKDKKTVKVALHFMKDNSGHSTSQTTADADGIVQTLNDTFTPQANIVFTKHSADAPTVPTNLGTVVRWCSSEPTNEWDDVVAAGKDATADLNLYFVWEYEQDDTPYTDNANGGTLGTDSLIEDNRGVRTIQHEVGHALGLPANNSDVRLLMNHSVITGTKILKSETDTINPP